MIFSWLKRRRRQKLLAEPFPAEWLKYLEANFAHYDLLTEEEQAKLRDDLRVLVAEKEWEGCGGLTITDEVKVTVAAQVALLVLGMEAHYFDRVVSVLVYPRRVQIPHYEAIGSGVALEGQRTIDGLAQYRGPVLLSWQEALEEGRDPEARANLVLHEFAHQLDMEDGEVNGTPLLTDRDLDRRWQEVMTEEYERLCDDVDEGLATLLDPYGATDAGEFFAVATECFFTRPRPLRRRHRELYEVFRDYYRQDPAKRVGRAE
jgi:Mlc titration factor MtfA (ptsG expression regulator)